ncbi:hypothetical protein OIN60_21975 [Paenibacillus sp. P96]|uniref:BclA C-terminal domain-containing protein n=1 Tax=Paenibacillus zeirhizosphaerae TaxID=2987519 RepID=A0ABT9FXD1_9BACL|nr:hypothetical protein [Paenibacillus sp. P96]MDP4099389.1 hypothetical protein [Paenibacillus sp. P96]
MTGPTGPTVTANNLVAGITSAGTPEFVLAGGIVPLDTFLQNGTAITNTNGNITLAPNQTYYVDYKVNVGTTTVTGVSVAVFLNGTIVPGTNTADFTNPPFTTTLAGNTIVNTGAGANILNIVNTGSSATFGATSVSVIKLA